MVEASDSAPLTDAPQRAEADPSLAGPEALMSVVRCFYDSINLLMGIVEVIGDDIRHLSDNALGAAFFGLTPDTMRFKLASELGVPQPYIKEWIGRYEESRRLGQVVRFEYGHEWKGQQHWLRAAVAPIDAPNGQAWYTYVVEDLTERRKAEEALRTNETRYRLAVRAANGVIWDWDTVTGTVIWSDTLRLIFGYPPEEPGSTIQQGVAWWGERIHPEDREQVLASFHAAVESPGRELWSVEYRFRCADGRYVTVLDQGYIARDPAGRAMRMIGSMVDISERKRAEAERERLLTELQEERRQLEASKTELQERLRDLETFHDVAVGRELKMMALEKELEGLRRQLGHPG